MIDEAYEIEDYLPIDDLEISDYVSRLFNSVLVMHEKEEYQFSYFALHLIFMTYIYSTIWKIGRFHQEKYEDSLLFVRPYQGCKVDFKAVTSIFDYSYLPEKDVFEIFVLIGLDNAYIKSVKNLIDTRNNMAHATGKIQILSDSEFNKALELLLSIISNIQNKMENTIRLWYEKELRNYATNGLPNEYGTVDDFIQGEFISKFSFSKKDFDICYKFGLSKLKNRTTSGLSREEIAKVIEFHEAIKEKYQELS